MIAMVACGDNNDATAGTTVAPNASIQGTGWVLNSVAIGGKMVDGVAVAALDFDADGTGCVI